ncbi:MAG: phage tail protein [Gemmatimonadales bacterium]
MRSGPGSDPKFTALKREVRSKQQTLGKHPPAKTEANAAQGAAKPPQDDKEAQGKTANAEKMNAAKPGEFDKAAFVKAVNEAIKNQAPKNLDEADKFGDSGKADAVKGEVQGKVGAGKESSAKAIETTTKAPPDTAAAKDKQVTPLRPDQPPPKPGAPDPSQAVPDKAPPAATDFSAGPKQVDQQMADAQVTEEQLAKSNEPEFTGALKEKKAGEAHAATAPGQVRGAEAKTLAGAKEQAAQAGATAMTTMAGDRAKAGKDVGAGKEGAKSEDEKKREQVTAKLQKVFDVTKKDVEDILNGLDKKVDDKFDSGEKAARDAFTAEYTRKMDAYKDKRYSGLMGKGRWVKDLFADLPSEVNVFYEQARENYVNRMQGVISDVADVIGGELTRAKQRIAKGRDDLQAEVKKLPADLQAIGKEAAGEFEGKFDELTQSVNDKGTQLVDTLASKYTAALKAVDEEIAAEKEKNKGLVSKAVDAVKGAIDTILKLKDLLLGVLAKAAQAVMAIIKDPIGFLGKLVSAVGAGLKAFMANIAAHLQKGLVSWLLGAAAKAGLQLPERFDIKGILLLIGSLLGLTWGAIRGRVVQRGVPEQAMGAVESSVPMAKKIQSEGIGGIWEQLKEKVGDLKGTLLAKIAQYLIPTVIIAGITWIVSLLNPASAFIKACKAIIDIVMFIIERGAQIIAFVNAVLDAVIAIAGGGAGGVPGLIEKALALSIPVLIGFLAALLGIGGLADKVKKLFQSLSKPVMKAVDWIVGKIAALAKKLWAKLKRKGKDRTPERKERDLRAGLAAADKLATKKITLEKLQDKLPRIRSKYRLTRLDLIVDKKTSEASVIHFVGEANPSGSTSKRTIPGDPNIKAGDDIQARSGSKWVICQVTEVTDTHLQYLGHDEVGKISGLLLLTGVNKSWRKYRPEAGYKVGAAFEAIRTLSTWTNFNDARQVLSYRAHGKFTVPPGKNWHHIHENSAGGAHSVANLVLATAGQNQDFNVWFSRVQRGTGQLSVREFLRDQDASVHKTWGLDCIRKHGLSVRMADLGLGPYQELV